MNIQSYLHTPEGVRDIYNDECARKLAVTDAVRRVFHRFGYEDIQTPPYEYAEIFDQESGSVDFRQMVKFFGSEGLTLVLRPDFTPSVARCVAKYYAEDQLPVRLCYEGNTFVSDASLRGRRAVHAQAGVELVGDASPAADAEIIAMVIQSLLETGLTDFQIEVGEVGFFGGLLKEAGIQAQDEARLRDLIEKKNFFGVRELAEKLIDDSELREIFGRLPELFGSFDQVISSARRFCRNDTSREALDRLLEVGKFLSLYGVDQYVSLDLGMLGQYNYYTGIIFKGYTHSTGEPIVTGGRYDHLMSRFGRDCPAVGFAFSLDTLLAAMSRQKITVRGFHPDCIILYEPDCVKEAIAEAMNRRIQGESVRLICRDDSLTPDTCLQLAADSGIPQVWHFTSAGITLLGGNE